MERETMLRTRRERKRISTNQSSQLEWKTKKKIRRGERGSHTCCLSDSVELNWLGVNHRTALFYTTAPPTASYGQSERERESLFLLFFSPLFFFYFSKRLLFWFFHLTGAHAEMCRVLLLFSLSPREWKSPSPPLFYSLHFFNFFFSLFYPSFLFFRFSYSYYDYFHFYKLTDTHMAPSWFYSANY